MQKRRTYTVDVQHLQSCTGLVADQDDGLHPSLRWRLHPPPLTLYSARWLLGWASYATLVPPAAPKRDHHGHLLEPALELSLPEPWTGHRDPDTGRTFYYNKVTKDATWREPQAPLRLPMDVVLPEPWEAHRAQGTDWTFFYNRDTGESTWKHPQPSQCEDEEEVEVEVEPDDVASSYPGETTGNTRGHKGYQSTDVDEHGRLRPRPKKRPAVLLPAEESELPHDATLEILAGDLVLKSVNAVASAGSSSGGSAPHKSQRRTKPSHPAACSAASTRPERVKKTEANVTSGGSGKRGPPAGPPMRDPRSLPPSIWFMEGDPDDDAPLPPPKAVAKAKAKPRTARAQARMMSALLKISRANRARAAAVATKTGASAS